MLNTTPNIAPTPLPGLMPGPGAAPAKPQGDGPGFAQVLDQAADLQRGPRGDAAAAADAPPRDDAPVADGGATRPRTAAELRPTASTRQAAARQAAWANATTPLPQPSPGASDSDSTVARDAPTAPPLPDEAQRDGQDLLDLATLMSAWPLAHSATSVPTDSAATAARATQPAGRGAVQTPRPLASLSPGSSAVAQDEGAALADRGSTVQFLHALGNATSLPANGAASNLTLMRGGGSAPGTAADSAEAKAELKAGADVVLQAAAAGRHLARLDTDVDHTGNHSAVPMTLATVPSPGAGAAPRTDGSTPPLQAQVDAALGTPEFAPALGSQLSVLVRDGIEHAQLRLNPADMGPIEVRISLDGTQAQVDFSAAQAGTRQALQDAVPALASALRESGLTLTGGGVFEQPREQRGETRQDAPRQGAASSEATRDAAPPSASPPRMPRARGAVDLYA